LRGEYGHPQHKALGTLVARLAREVAVPVPVEVGGFGVV